MYLISEKIINSKTWFSWQDGYKNGFRNYTNMN